MFQNYMITALRYLIRQKGFSFINIMGLAFGLACALLILLWVQDELSYDRFHEYADHLYRVEENQYYSGETYHVNVTPYPSGPVWKDEIPEVEDACRFQWPSGMLFRYGENSFYEEGCVAVDSTFLDIFTFPLIKGNRNSVLSEPYSAVLTRKVAGKYFGDEDPMGKTLTVNNQYEFTVTGILEDPPLNSIVRFDILIPFDYLKEIGQYSDSWGRNAIRTFVLIDKNAVPDTVNNKLTRIVRKNNPESNTDFLLAPLKDIHLHAYFGFGHNPGAIIYVYIFSSIAVFVLLIACINFMNLSTARSSNRAREIGLRKVSGAGRKAIIIQFFGESILLAFISLVFALIIVRSVLHVFNTVSGKELDFINIMKPGYIVSMIALTILAGIISGIYPALYLSAFRPIIVLRGNLSSGIKSRGLRKLLVITQFTLSVLLIIGTLIVYRQLNYMKSKDLGYDREHLFVFQLRGGIKDHYYILKEEWLKNPQVLNVTASLQSPMHMSSNSDGGRLGRKRS
jgi:putative ABC transport system permease protein